MHALIARWSAPAAPPHTLPILVVVAVGVVLSVAWDVPTIKLAAGMCAGAVAVSSIRIAVLVLAFLAPFDGYISQAVVYQDFLAADLAGLAIIVGQWRRGARIPRDGITVATLAALALLVALHLLSLSSHNWREASDNVARFLYFVGLVAAIASAGPSLPIRSMGGCLVAGVALRFLYEGVFYFSSPTFVLHPSFQFGAMTSNPNTLAGLAACVVPIGCSFVLAPGSRSRRVLAAAATLLLVSGIFLSYSKGAWLTLSAAVALWLWHVARKRTLRWRAICIALVLAASAAALVPQARQIPGLIIERWTSQGSVISNRERVRYLETAAVLIREHPVLGVGLERFGQEYVRARNAVRGPEDPHNAYLMIAAELGVPALGCYLFLLVVLSVATYRRADATDVRHGPMRTALSACVIGLLTFQLFSAEPLTSRILWVILALAVAQSREGSPGHTPEGARLPVQGRSRG